MTKSDPDKFVANQDDIRSESPAHRELMTGTDDFALGYQWWIEHGGDKPPAGQSPAWVAGWHLAADDV